MCVWIVVVWFVSVVVGLLLVLRIVYGVLLCGSCVVRVVLVCLVCGFV